MASKRQPITRADLPDIMLYGAPPKRAAAEGSRSDTAGSRSVNRRNFLKVSTAAGGGLIVGFNWLAGCQTNDRSGALLAEPNMPDAFAAVNAFVKVGENGVVTIMSPNPEIGQNVKTSMPMIVAEELDVDWANVVVEQAPLDTDNYTRQLAGGSQSIRRGWNSLRQAGATARRMLVDAAAAHLEVPASELTTADGVITHAASRRSLGYGDVATAAAGLPIPEDVALKDVASFKIIGTSRKNVDAKKIVTGQPLFGLDTKRDGMLIAMIIHPPAFGMRPKSFDATTALSMPGIRNVFSIDASVPEDTDTWSDVNAFPELVVVLGETTWQVMKAKQTVTVEWESFSPQESTDAQTAALADLIASAPRDPARLDGDPDAAFADAATVVERSYTGPFLAHNTLEPMNFFADVRDDRAELTGPIQTPENLRRSAAVVLRLPEESISVNMTRMGGGFGRRLYGNFGIEAAVISQRAGAPVKLVYTREDDMTQGTYRPAYHVAFRAGLDADGNLTAFHVRGAGIPGDPVDQDRFPARAVENYLAEKLGLDSNVSTGAWRAPRSNFMAFAEQAFLDEVAEAAGKDPIEFRLALFDRAASDPIGAGHRFGDNYDPERYAGVLRLVRDKSNWGSEKPGLFRGVSAYYCHNSYVAQVVDVILDDEGNPKVDKVWCAVDCGIVINPDAARNQAEGGIIDGIGHAMYSALTLTNGVPDQRNFDTYRLIRNPEAPREIEVFFVESDIDPTGLGEPTLPPVSPALANALYKATGQRLRDQPFVGADGSFRVREPVG